MVLDMIPMAVVPAVVEALIAGAALVSTGAVAATVKAALQWIRSADRDLPERVIIEVNGHRVDVSGMTGDDLERSLHQAIDQASRP